MKQVALDALIVLLVVIFLLSLWALAWAWSFLLDELRR